MTTLDNWQEEMENIVVSPFSNGGAERANRSMKQAENQAFGFPNLACNEKLMIMQTFSAQQIDKEPFFGEKSGYSKNEFWYNRKDKKRKEMVRDRWLF